MKAVHFPGKASDFLKIGVAAAGRGDVPLVQEILKARPHWLNRLGPHGRTMLWEASHRGKLEMVNYLVKRKAKLDARGTHYTPYFVEISCYGIARHKRHEKVADFLLEKGAKRDLHTEAFLGNLTEVKKILRRSSKRLHEGCPQHVMGEMTADGSENTPAPAPWATPLVYAVRGGDVETMRFLIERGAKVQGNEEALFIAAQEDPARVALLEEHGASRHGLPESSPSEELVYLCRGDRGGNPKVVRELLAAGADVNHQDGKGKTALHRASRSGFLETMGLLLKKKASTEISDGKGETPLFDAIRSTIKKRDRRAEAIRILREAGANLQHANKRGQTPEMLLGDEL